MLRISCPEHISIRLPLLRFGQSVLAIVESTLATESGASVACAALVSRLRPFHPRSAGLRRLLGRHLPHLRLAS